MFKLLLTAGVYISVCFTAATRDNKALEKLKLTHYTHKTEAHKIV